MLKISVGIPAHNEQTNISALIKSVLAQRPDGLEVLEVIVVSDGSTDGTADAVRTEAGRDARVKLIEHSDRTGQANRQNEILRMFAGDALLLLNADVSIPDAGFLASLAREMAAHPDAGVVSPSILPLPAQNFFESVINYSVRFKQSMYEKINGMDNIYLCHGRARLLSRKFADGLMFPNAVGEDAFSYVACKDQGFSFRYLPSARIMYRSPQNLEDHLKQSKRFLKGRLAIAGQSDMKSFYRIPTSVLAWGITKYFLLNPIYFLCYLSILIMSRIQAQYYQLTTLWEEAASSKKL